MTAVRTVVYIEPGLVEEDGRGFQSNLKLGPRCTVRQVLVIKQRKTTMGKKAMEGQGRGGGAWIACSAIQQWGEFL